LARRRMLQGEEIPYRSVLGFYKEGTDRVILKVMGDGSSLYVEIPSRLRNRAEVVVGSRLKGKLKRVYRAGRKVEEKVDWDFDWEVEGYWNELHIPQEVVSALGLRPGDYLELVFQKVVNYGEEFEL